MESNSWRMKQELCEIGTRIWQKGFCAGNEGNHSVRISDDRVLITPSGVSKGMLTPDMICMTDMDGQVIGGSTKWKASSERKVHNAIYRHRPDVRAVIHSHPPHATAFAIAGLPLPEGIHPEAEVFLGRVPLAEYATPSTDDLPNSIIPLIGPETNSVLMGNHGTVSFDTDLIGAYYKLEILDAYCRVLLLTKQVGHANVLNDQQMTELLEVKAKFGMKDPRLECSMDGCVGPENERFLASFDVRPAGAMCDCDTGRMSHAGAAVNGGRTSVSEADFEQMVQSITDQIMAAGK